MRISISGESDALRELTDCGFVRSAKSFFFGSRYAGTRIESIRSMCRLSIDWWQKKKNNSKSMDLDAVRVPSQMIDEQLSVTNRYISKVFKKSSIKTNLNK